MKKSELKNVIKEMIAEEMKGTEAINEVEACGCESEVCSCSIDEEEKIEEGFINGEAVSPEMQAAIMSAVGLGVAAIGATEFKEEIADFMSKNWTKMIKSVKGKVDKGQAEE